MQWPNHFPENCPPPSALAPSGKFYRFIEQNHTFPQPEDFSSWRVLNLDKKCPENITECQACGLSVYDSFEEIQRMQKVIPRLRRMKIAVGILNKHSGKIQNTPSRNSRLHYTWWVAVDEKPWQYFLIS